MFTSAPSPVFLSSRPACPLPACNCDTMGSVSMQCHSNGTCHCREGFVGYKCDKCEMNYFYDKATHQCEECPVCYGLVKKQVSSCVCLCEKHHSRLATCCGFKTAITHALTQNIYNNVWIQQLWSYHKLHFLFSCCNFWEKHLAIQLLNASLFSVANH